MDIKIVILTDPVQKIPAPFYEINENCLLFIFLGKVQSHQEKKPERLGKA